MRKQQQMNNPQTIITTPRNTQDKATRLVHAALTSGRRYFGSSGASLTHQVYNPPEGTSINQKAAKIGLDGERDATKFLRAWCADKPTVVLVDSVSIQTPSSGPDPRLDVMSPEDIKAEDAAATTPNEEDGVIDGKDTDHILIIGDAVLLVDTKNWRKGMYTVSPGGEVMRNRKPTSFPGGKVRMRGAIELWRKYLGYSRESGLWGKLTGVVFINNDDKNMLVVRNRNWYRCGMWRLVERNRMLEYLDNVYDNPDMVSPYDKTHINTDLVARIVRCAVPPYDERARVLDAGALRAFGI